MTTGSRLTESKGLGARVERLGLAPWSEVACWATVASVVAAVLLGCVALFSSRDPGTYVIGLDSGLLATHHDFGDMMYVFRRNLLVLGIHLCACWIGAIVGRSREPTPEKWGRFGAFDRPVPNWMGRASLFYALLVTMLSVVVQAISLGRELADISRATTLSRSHLLVLVLPHAVPELIAVFLPLGLFLLEAHRGRLERLGPWSLQAAAIALPVLLCAAAIETYVSPPRVIAASRSAQIARADRLTHAHVTVRPPRS